jgi:hypothetical protein
MGVRKGRYDDKTGTGTPTAAPARARTPAVVAGLVGGLTLAATVTIGGGAASPAWASSMAPRVADGATGGGLNTIVNGYSKISSKPFSATYHVVDATTHENENITFIQDPPKEAVISPNGSFYITPSAVTVCQGSGHLTCERVPTALLGPVDSLKELFSPGVLVETLKGIQGIVAAHQAGVNTSSATYGRLSSTCITLTGKKYATPVTYCAANSSGVMDHVNANGATISLTTFSSHPSASTVSPPAGAKITTVPKGV